MIKAVIVLDSAKHLNSVQISGHAGFMQDKGDPICSAVTILVRTIGRYLQQEGLLSGVQVDEGFLELKLVPYDDVRIHFALNILQLGLNDLMAEWADHVELTIKEKRR